MKQYFKFKIKDEYLPSFIKELKYEGKIADGKLFKSSEILCIDNKYLRLLKIKNLENNISERDKEFLKFLLDDRFTVFLTNEQCDFLRKITNTTTTTTSATHVTTTPPSYNVYSPQGIVYTSRSNDFIINGGGWL